MKKEKSKKHRKFRLLLDAAFAKPLVFKKLSKKANVAHIVFDYKFSNQISDDEIYDLAIREKRFVVTINVRHFKTLIKPNKPGIICVPPYLSNDKIDEMLTNFVSGKNPDNYLGKVCRV